MNHVALLVMLVVASALSTSCSGSSQSMPTAPTNVSDSSDTSSSGSSAASSTADLLSGSWTLVSVQPAGNAPQITPAGASYTLTFADGRLSTRMDCNICTGAFTVSNGTLSAGPNFACTRAACPTMDFGDTYTKLLAGESGWTASSTSLELSSARGVLRFAR